MNKRGCRLPGAFALFMPLAIIAGTLARAADVGPGYDIEMSRMIPVRDGIELEAWITEPSHLTAKVPTVLTLTQYDIDGGRHGDSAGYYARRGYAFVQAYVRGRGRSGGVKSENLGTQVGRDGYDLVEWIAAQPWSDGRVVMFGGSFVGMTQWQTASQLPTPSSAAKCVCRMRVSLDRFPSPIDAQSSHIAVSTSVESGGDSGTGNPPSVGSRAGSIWRRNLVSAQ